MNAVDGRADSGDRAGMSYWNEAWQRAPLPKLADPGRAGRWNFPNRELERFLRSHLTTAKAGNRLLEFGCARSIWLPYFSTALGYSVTGIDYSETGCEQTRQLLNLAGVKGDVVCADFFKPPDALLGAFDVVFSYGVAEHFDDTSACLAAFARYLAPGGLMITLVPNMTGLPGLLQKELNRPVFDKHVPLDRAQLTDAHVRAGLSVEDSGYLVSANFGVVNLEGLPPRTPAWLAKKALMATLCRMSLVGWYVDEHVTRLPAVGALAAYVQCVARRPVEALGPNAS